MSGQRRSTAIFLSGSGRTLANLIQHRDHHGLPIHIDLVISSHAHVRGVAIARSAGIDTRIVRKSAYPDPDRYCRAMFDPCREAEIELVIMAGFLKHVLIPDDYAGRVINIHPSLLPKFGGPGMYGNNVHQAVIDSGDTTSGCTVHFVDNQYDNGPVVLQRSCAVLPNDTATSLAARVFDLECEALPAAIQQIVAERNSLPSD